MESRNLISAYEGANALLEIESDLVKKYFNLKPHEVLCLKSMCQELDNHSCSIRNLDGFYISYKIPQINKEFDLLRFGTSSVINIELKSELNDEVKIEKICKQMSQNYHYLQSVSSDIQIFTYVQNDGFYQLDLDSLTPKKITADVVVASIKGCQVDYAVDPDMLFVPSKFLISPFNCTERFINNEYFLTESQSEVKKKIFEGLSNTPFMFFTISANAGTGKTLLVYDIAKELVNSGKNILIIHCGKLNVGHESLKSNYGWNIKSISNIPANDYNSINDYDFIFVDESQRINKNQLESIIMKALDKSIPVLFSFDTKQFLKEGETTDIAEYVKTYYPFIRLSQMKLKNKIRTNKNMASFIDNLMRIGTSKNNLFYDHVSIEYFDNLVEVQNYVSILENKGWTAITYTTSNYNPESYSYLSCLSSKKAHDVIGQEFPKVVLVMDRNFWYNEDNQLCFSGSYYSAKGMLYQIVTRVVDDLKIVVLNNAGLYQKLLEIKTMGK